MSPRGHSTTQVEDRPSDTGIAKLQGATYEDALEWMTQRLRLVAMIPSDAARAGALLPMYRELARLPQAERFRLTGARINAFYRLPRSLQDHLVSARMLAASLDPVLFTGDAHIVREVEGRGPRI